MSLSLPNPWENIEDADWLHLTDGEQVKWSGRPSRYTIAPVIAGGILLAAAGIFITWWFRPVAVESIAPDVFGFAPLVISAVGVSIALGVYLNWLRLLYVITDEEIYVKHGLISRDVTQVRLDRVQNTAYNQSVIERSLNYGNVRIYTAGTSTEDITLDHVPAPARVNQILTELLSNESRSRHYTLTK
ncbi:PH domain-containing protein [Halorubraceae archaeon YAN]|nr:PH domain-containing protein [Halorubraceae archaeon YAN]